MKEKKKKKKMDEKKKKKFLNFKLCLPHASAFLWNNTIEIKRKISQGNRMKRKKKIKKKKKNKKKSMQISVPR